MNSDNNPGINGQTDYRNPVIPMVLSLFFPGIGQVYNGGGGAHGLIRFIITMTGYFCLIIPGLILHLYFINDSYKTRKRMNNMEIPAISGTGKDYLIYFIIPLLILICYIKLIFFSGTFVFAIAPPLFHTKMVAFVIGHEGSNITITNYGGEDRDQVEKVFVSLNNGQRQDLTDRLKNIGDAITLKMESDKDHIEIFVLFSDGSLEKVLEDDLHNE